MNTFRSVGRQAVTRVLPYPILIVLICIIVTYPRHGADVPHRRLIDVDGEDLALVNELAGIHGDVIGEFPEYRHPELSRIVMRGVDTIPNLIASLDNTRLTGIRIATRADKAIEGHQPTAVSIEFGRSYDPKLAVIPIELECGHINRGAQSVDEYTVTVGDICFFLIGEIVNRNNDPISMSNGQRVSVRSPSRCDAFSSATRREWQFLDSASHKASLVRDLNCPWRLEGALVRLWFFYREETEPIIVNMLRRPIYDERLAQKLLESTLADERNGIRARKPFATDTLLEDGVKLLLLRAAYEGGHPEQQHARRIVLSDCPEFADFNMRISVCSLSDEIFLIRRLGNVESQPVAQEIEFLCRRILSEPRSVWDRKVLDDFVIASMWHLEGRASSVGVFSGYCRERIRSLDGHDAKYWRSWLEKWEHVRALAGKNRQ